MEIDELKDDLKQQEKKWLAEVNRINYLADKESQCRLNVEKNLRNQIAQLKEELKLTKTVLRYPKLYHKYYDKKFECIKNGLLGEDSQYIGKHI